MPEAAKLPVLLELLQYRDSMLPLVRDDSQLAY
jgi:hypothetical protein